MKHFLPLLPHITRPVVVGAVATLAVLAGLSGWRHRDTDVGCIHTEVTAAFARVSRENGHSAALAHGHRWVSGTGRAYVFRLGLQFTPEARHPAAVQAAMDLDISGVLHLHVLQRDGASVTVAMGLSGAQVLASGAPHPRLADLIERSPCVLDLGLDGSIKAQRWNAALADEDRRLLTALYHWPFVLREGLSTWSTTEEDDTGRCIADYRVLADGAVSKSRRSMMPRVQPQADAPTVTQVMESSRFTGLPGDVWLEKLTGEETTQIRLNDQAFGRSRVSVSFVRTEAAQALPPALAALVSQPATAPAFTIAADPGATSTFEQIRLQERAEKHRGKALATVLQPLQAAAARDASHADTLPALQDMVDWLRENPQSTSDVATVLKTMTDDQVSALLAHSLEAADTPQSQDALVAVLEDFRNCPTPALLQAIVAASGLSDLKSERIVPALREIVAAEFGGGMEFTANDTALFALAELARHDAGLRDELATALVPRLAPSESPEDIRTTLLALQNAAIEDGRTAAQSLAASHEDPLVRQTATDYLATLPSP